MAKISRRQTPQSPPTGLYVHIPFCRTKCGYCDFFSVPLGCCEAAPLVQSILCETGVRLRDGSHHPNTLFIGGGTPTILPVDDLAHLLAGLGRILPTESLAEFTVEANPATVDDRKAALLVNAGVTRVSMGAQSFLAAELAVLERSHLPEDVKPSVALLRRHGVPQVNLDLIFAMPGQTLDTWGASLHRAIELDPDHIACYALTYEPGTRLTNQVNRGEVHPCGEELEAEMFELAIDTLADAGYEQYEISNYARPGCACKHNLIYWRNQPYIGVGPSAAGCYNDQRYKNVSDVADYVRMIDEHNCAEAESETIDTRKLMIEMVMMQIRLTEGLSADAFHRRTGVDPLVVFDATLKRMEDLGFVTTSNTHIALTRPGRLVADTVIRELAAACED